MTNQQALIADLIAAKLGYTGPMEQLHAILQLWADAGERPEYCFATNPPLPPVPTPAPDPVPAPAAETTSSSSSSRVSRSKHHNEFEDGE